jgi:hypothetical protein
VGALIASRGPRDARIAVASAEIKADSAAKARRNDKKKN